MPTSPQMDSEQMDTVMYPMRNRNLVGSYRVRSDREATQRHTSPCRYHLTRISCGMDMATREMAKKTLSGLILLCTGVMIEKEMRCVGQLALTTRRQG